MNPAPVLRLRGVVHAEPILNPVPAVPASPATTDEAGNVLRPARQAREGYDKYDVTILTDDGGFVTLVVLDKALAVLGGEMPCAKGEKVDLPVYGYVAWRGEYPRRFAVPGYSLAAEVLAAEKSRTGSAGARVAAVS